MQAFTDYPIRQLGDKEFKQAPVREVKVKAYDGDKYCTVLVEGLIQTIKAGYLYTSPGRFGEVEGIDVNSIKN